MHRPGPLTRREREILAVRVSGLNHCPYWIHHHGAGLRRILAAEGRPAGEQEALVAALLGRALPATGLSSRERALIRYGDTLTLAPASITDGDIEPLRQAGLDDRAIHDACAIVAYFAFVNRIADGLGVEIESP
jgi:uncharacterized peroxidase-related enzyme